MKGLLTQAVSLIAIQHYFHIVSQMAVTFAYLLKGMLDFYIEHPCFMKKPYVFADDFR